MKIRGHFLIGGILAGLCTVSGQVAEKNSVPVLKESLVANTTEDFLVGAVRGVGKPKAVFLPKPEYPVDARQAGADGTVRVQIYIDAEGNVTQATMISGNPLLRSVSETAAGRSKFRMVRDTNGSAVRSEAILAYSFEIQRAGWIKIAHGLSLLDRLPIASFCIPTALKAFPADWTNERQMLESLNEIRRISPDKQVFSARPTLFKGFPPTTTSPASASASMQMHLPTPSKPPSDQIILAQNLIIALRERLKDDELAAWQFDIGLNLDDAMRTTSAAIIRKFVESAPRGAAPEVVTALRSLESAFAADKNSTESLVAIRRSFLGMLSSK